MGMPASDSQRWIIGICATCSVKCCFSKQQLASECSLIFSYVSDWSIASPMLEAMMLVRSLMAFWRRPCPFPKRKSACRTSAQFSARPLLHGAEHSPRRRQSSAVVLASLSFSASSTFLQ
jgi:hypothetical protein